MPVRKSRRPVIDSPRAAWPTCHDLCLMHWSLAIAALALLAVASLSRRLSGAPVTPAMLFVAIGLVVGPEVLGGVDLASTGSIVRTLAEATLALVLFCDASRIDLGALRAGVGLPARFSASVFHSPSRSGRSARAWSLAS